MARDILEFLQEIGVDFVVHVWGGSTGISAAVARMFVEKNFSKDQVQAHLAGVSLETYYKWVEWNNQGQPCQALTRKGKRCRKGLQYPRGFGPSDFEMNGFCDLHWERFNK